MAGFICQKSIDEFYTMQVDNLRQQLALYYYHTGVEWGALRRYFKKQLDHMKGHLFYFTDNRAPLQNQSCQQLLLHCTYARAHR